MIIWVCMGREDTRMGLIARWLGIRHLLAALSATVTYRPGMIPIVPLEMSPFHTTAMKLLELPDSRVRR